LKICVGCTQNGFTAWGEYTKNRAETSTLTDGRCEEHSATNLALAETAGSPQMTQQKPILRRTLVKRIISATTGFQQFTSRSRDSCETSNFNWERQRGLFSYSIAAESLSVKLILLQFSRFHGKSERMRTGQLKRIKADCATKNPPRLWQSHQATARVHVTVQQQLARPRYRWTVTHTLQFRGLSMQSLHTSTHLAKLKIPYYTE